MLLCSAVALAVGATCVRLRAQSATQEAPADEPEVRIVLTATDREAADFLKQAELATAGGQYDKAIDLLQTLLTGDRKMLIGQRDDLRRYAGLRQRALTLLAALPAEAKANYVRQYEPPAAKLVEQYQASGDTAVLRRAAEDFSLTPSGRRAMDELGAIAYDRGDFLAAGFWWSRGGGENALSQTRIAAAYHAAGDAVRAGGALQRLESRFADERVVVAGKSVRAAEWTRQLLAKSSANAPVNGALPVAAVGIWSWPAAPAVQQKLASAMAGEFIDGEGFRVAVENGRPVATFAQQSGGRFARTFELADVVRPITVVINQAPAVVARVESGLIAIEPATGRELWRKNFILHEDSDAAKGSATSPFLGITGDIGRCEIAAGEGKIFAVGRYRAVDPSTYRRFALDASEDVSTLAAFDAATGKQLWAVGRGGAAGETLSTAKFLAAPAYHGGRLYVIARIGAEYHGLALDAANGKLLWQTAIGAVPTTSGEAVTWQAGYAVQTMTERGTPPTVAGHNVVFATNAGLIAALDSASGKPAWGYRYDSTVAGQVSDEYLRPVVDRAYDLVLARRPVRTQNNLLVERGRLICLPSDSEQVLVIDPNDGTLLWSRPREQAEYLATAANAVLLVSPHVTALDLATGETVRKIESEVVGRPAVIGSQVVAAARGEIKRINLADGSVGRLAAVHGNLLAGSVTIVGDGIVTANAAGLSGFVDERIASQLLNQRLTGAADAGVKLELRLTQAQLMLESGELAKAVEMLAALEKDAAGSPDISKRVRAAYAAALMKQLPQAPAGAVATLLTNAQRVADTTQQKLVIGLAAVKRYEAVGDRSQAAQLAVKLAKEHAAVVLRDPVTGEITSGYAVAQREASRLGSDVSADALAAGQLLPMFSLNQAGVTLLRDDAEQPVVFAQRLLASDGAALLTLDASAVTSAAASEKKLEAFAPRSRNRRAIVLADGAKLALVDDETLLLVDKKFAIAAKKPLRDLGVEGFSRLVVAGERVVFIMPRGRLVCVDLANAPVIAWTASGYDAHTHRYRQWLLQEDPRDRGIRVVHLGTGRVASFSGGRRSAEAMLVQSPENFLVAQTNDGVGVFDCRRLERQSSPIVSWPFERDASLTFLATHKNHVLVRSATENDASVHLLNLDEPGKVQAFAWPAEAGEPRQVWQQGDQLRVLAGRANNGQEGLITPHIVAIDLGAGKVLWAKALNEENAGAAAVRVTAATDNTLTCIVRLLSDRSKSELVVVEPNGTMVRTSLHGVESFRGTSPGQIGPHVVAENDSGLVFFRRGR